VRRLRQFPRTQPRVRLEKSGQRRVGFAPADHMARPQARRHRAQRGRIPRWLHHPSSVPNGLAGGHPSPNPGKIEAHRCHGAGTRGLRLLHDRVPRESRQRLVPLLLRVPVVEMSGCPWRINRRRQLVVSNSHWLNTRRQMWVEIRRHVLMDTRIKICWLMMSVCPR